MRPLLNGTFGQPQFVYGVVAGRIMVNVADESGLLFLYVVSCVVFMVFFVVGTKIPLPIRRGGPVQICLPINILLVALCYELVPIFREDFDCYQCTSFAAAIFTQHRCYFLRRTFYI